MREMSVSYIMEYVRRNVAHPRDYTYIILGRTGRTGKTWLCNALRDHGMRAFEISEDVCRFVNYNDEKNHFIIDHDNKKITIILNELI